MIFVMLSTAAFADGLPSSDQLVLEAQKQLATMPSNDQLLLKQQQKMQDFKQALDKAQAEMVMQPMRPVQVPQDELRRSPLQKALMGDMMRQAPSIGNGVQHKTGSDLIVFVSFSMPDEALKTYTEEARDAGATIVLRGMVDHSLVKTQAKAWQVSHGRSAWEINPGLFRKFKINTVPAIVLAQGDSHVTESGCAIPKDYLRVDGSVAIRQALLLMRRYGDGPLVQDAASRLDKLEHEK